MSLHNSRFKKLRLFAVNTYLKVRQAVMDGLYGENGDIDFCSKFDSLSSFVLDWSGVSMFPLSSALRERLIRLNIIGTKCKMRFS